MAPSEETNEETPAAIAAAENDESGGETTSQGNNVGETIEKIKKVLVLMASPLTDEKGGTKSVVAGITTIVLTGTCLGFAAPSNDVLSPSYRRISAALGYIYFMAWSVSFYPQVISNFKRKSTAGLSPDFCVLNVIGFACYTAYTASFYWSSTIQELYKERYGPDKEITVQSNDVAFAIHALVLSSLTVSQILYYNFWNLSSARLSKPICAAIVGIAIVCAGYPLLLVLSKIGGKHHHDNSYFQDSLGRFNWLDFLDLLGYIKIFISLIKYIPQVLLNFRRKSTVGWSIWNILLDLTGGTLSDLQLVLDCADLKDFSGITHNKVKLVLGSQSIVFDLIFLVQHYCLYSGSASTDEQLEPLLPPTEEAEEESPEDSSVSSSSVAQTIFV
eukprot:CAMPEP_0116140248 /NCGR_PEP_ID=MMETSP0329-20121206/13739_1 /TAXON_ID=697910 /ORGANISM="Pseudo-nitzschia arenysensis, Strain B593" /LENGTH=387 /DNA_ID=CAMNT_0003635335 /DNA_START=24 /DNA_END=1187 /DNA_ORIENTATION=+